MSIFSYNTEMRTYKRTNGAKRALKVLKLIGTAVFIAAFIYLYENHIRGVIAPWN